MSRAAAGYYRDNPRLREGIVRLLFTEVMHKLIVAVVGVAAGMYGYWYAQGHGQNLWVVGGIAAAGTLIVGLLFHPVVWVFRHRPRSRAVETVDAR